MTVRKIRFRVVVSLLSLAWLTFSAQTSAKLNQAPEERTAKWKAASTPTNFSISEFDPVTRMLKINDGRDGYKIHFPVSDSFNVKVVDGKFLEITRKDDKEFSLAHGFSSKPAKKFTVDASGALTSKRDDYAPTRIIYFDDGLGEWAHDGGSLQAIADTFTRMELFGELKAYEDKKKQIDNKKPFISTHGYVFLESDTRMSSLFFNPNRVPHFIGGANWNTTLKSEKVRDGVYLVTEGQKTFEVIIDGKNGFTSRELAEERPSSATRNH